MIAHMTKTAAVTLKVDIVNTGISCIIETQHIFCWHSQKSKFMLLFANLKWVSSPGLCKTSAINHNKIGL
jgi:hypothetical protein